jgi:hypothetical protein
VRLVELLKWAAGAPQLVAPLTLDDGHDSDDLLTAARYHRLGARLALLATDVQPWATRSVRHGLDEQRQEAGRRTLKLLACAGELAAAYGGDRPPLFVKGPFAHLLSGGRVATRWSQDLDVLPQDPERLVATVTSLGFEPYEKQPAPHELGFWRRDDIYLDTHAGIMVTGDPAAGWPSPASLAARGPLDPDELAVDQPRLLGYDDLVGGCRPLATPSGPVLMPGPELAVVIACMHTHRNCITADFPLRYGLVRLGELADLSDVVNGRCGAPFRHDVMRSLVDRFGAHDAVRFTAGLVERYLGTRLPAFWNGDGAPPYGRYLWWNGTPASFPMRTDHLEPPEDLIVRTSGLEVLTGALGATDVRAGNRIDSAPRYQAFDPASAAAPATGKLAQHLAGRPALGFSFAVSRDRSALDFRVRPSQALNRDARQAVYLNFGDTVFQFNLAGDNRLTGHDRIVGGGEPPPAAVTARVAQDAGGGRELNIHIPMANIVSSVPSDRELPVLLGVREWLEGVPYPSAATLLPLHVTPAG